MKRPTLCCAATCLIDYGNFLAKEELLTDFESSPGHAHQTLSTLNWNYQTGGCQAKVHRLAPHLRPVCRFVSHKLTGFQRNVRTCILRNSSAVRGTPLQTVPRFVNTRNRGNGALRRRPGTVIAAAIANYRYRANIAINDALADAPANTITRYRG